MITGKRCQDIAANVVSEDIQEACTSEAYISIISNKVSQMTTVML